MYEFLNNKYNNLSFKIKLELFLLPILIIYFLHFVFLTYFLKDEVSTYSKIAIGDFNKKFEDSYLELFSNIEYLANQNKIFIKNLSKDKKYVFLDGYGQKEDILIFLKNIEDINNFTRIDSLNLDKRDELGNYNFKFRVDLNRFYIKNNSSFFKKEPNSQVNKSEIKNENIFKINAIVLNYAFINDNWIKKNEKIDNYELVEIQRDFVILKKDEHTIKLELLHD